MEKEESASMMNPVKYIEFRNNKTEDLFNDQDNLLLDFRSKIKAEKYKDYLAELSKNTKGNYATNPSSATIDPNAFLMNKEDFNRAKRVSPIDYSKYKKGIETQPTKIPEEKTKVKKNIFEYTRFLAKTDIQNFIFLTLLVKYGADLIFSANDQCTERDNSEFKTKISDVNKKIEIDFKKEEKEYNPLNDDQASDFLKKFVRIFGKKHNSENDYVLKFIKIMHFNPLKIDRLYSKWKFYLGKLVAIWEYKRVVGLTNKIPINTLKLKFLLMKLFRNKEKEILFKYLPRDQEEKNDLFSSSILSTLKGDKFPRYSFLEASMFTRFLDFAVDASIIYLLILLPMDYVLKLDSEMLTFLQLICDCIFFVDIVKRCRTLPADSIKTTNYDLEKPFQDNAFSFKFLLDICSLLPIDGMYMQGNPDEISDIYKLSKFIVLMRMFSFGKGFKYLESTKFAVAFRLLRLMGQFVFLIHWLGLFLLVFFEQELMERNFDASCLTYDPSSKYTTYCLYVETVYSGAFIVPGRTLQNWELLVGGRVSTQYFFLFCVFLTGQIITASVFGSVSELIKSLNQTENKFQEINDSHRITGLYFKTHKPVFQEIQLYYEYIWLKHGERIFGMEIFDDLSPILMKKFMKEKILVNFKYLLKDFIQIKSRKNKFMTFIITNLKKYITSPYEKLIIQGSVIPGLFILANGTVFFEDNLKKRKDLGGEMKVYPNLIAEKMLYVQDKLYDKYITDKICFPWDSLFIKTGRAVQTYYVKYFTDLFFFSLEFFDEELLDKYPNEMKELSIKAKLEGTNKLGKDIDLFNLVSKKSHRSTGIYYEKKYYDYNIWIDVKYLLPKYKIKSNTLTNQSDLIENMNYSKGLFEIFHCSKSLANFFKK